MKKILFIIIGLSSLLFAETVEEYISKSKVAAQSGNLKQATEIMETAIVEHPQSADAYAQYGLYLSQLAGQASFLKAGMLSDKSFKQHDKALEIEQGHMYATLYRGILGVNVPKFMGKLKQAIKDLEFVQKRYGKNSQIFLTSSYYLGLGYLKNKEQEKARLNFKFIVMYGKDSSYYKDAKAQYEKLTAKSTPEKSDNSYREAMKCLENNQLNDALKYFRISAKQDSSNLELYLIYARTLGNIAGQDYDETIAEDITYRASLAHEVFEVLSHCVELAPGDDEIRFLRGSVAINLPFFVNSLDTGIEDLTYLSEQGKTNETKAKASFLLKKGIELKQTFELAEAGYNADSDEEKQKLLSKFITTKSPINQTKPEGDYLKIEMTLGYRDQIAPQTAVWIEDAAGNYIKTIYISGFAANVKDKQMHLPRWAESSEFRNIAAVTGASIDCGKHLFYWDFTDFSGNQIKDNKFTIHTEICHWPHVQYVERNLEIDLEKDKEFRTTSSNFLIPELVANWISHKKN
ncbi:MAG: DUF2271 domain-containing protein [Candidatus Cloacimonetes bacterium]|nr:DUF2271 domain-containing protein [Candidatus Cloacimonadota bacterium]